MYFFIPIDKPEVSSEKVIIKRGGKFIIFLGLLTIFSAVNFHNILHLPPMLGMMFGLGLLGIYSFYLKITFNPSVEDEKFDFFRKVSRAEWDTLLFFFDSLLDFGRIHSLLLPSYQSRILSYLKSRRGSRDVLTYAKHAHAHEHAARSRGCPLQTLPRRSVSSPPLPRGAGVSSPLSACGIALPGPCLGPVQLFAR